MSNNNGTCSSRRDQFRCLFCSTSSSGEGIGSSPLEGRGAGNESNKNLYRMVFILHKLLQIPLWECTKYLISSEDGSINSLKLCSLCAKMVDEGQSLVEKVERLQLKLQTLQATLQNQLLSGQDVHMTPTALDQSKLRNSIRDEIRNNVCRSSLQSCSFSFGAGEGQLNEIVQPTGASTPTELDANAQGQEGRIHMTFEAGEVKVETEDSFNYEVIDLVDDNDGNEYGNNQLGQDWDDMVSEVTGGGCGTIDRRVSQRREGPSCSATLSTRGTDMSPLSGPPRRKRTCSVMEDGSSDASIPTPSPPVQMSQQLMLKQQSSQPGTSPQQYHSQQQPTPQTQQSTSVTLLQTLLSNPQNLTPQSAFTSPASTQGKQVVWSGVLEWNERRIRDGLHYRHPIQVSCRIYAAVVNHIPMVNTAGWPAKLLMQYIPKAFVAAVRPATDLLAKTVLVEFDQPLSPQVQQMTRVLDGGYAGCIRFAGAHPNCLIKLMALVHVRSKGAYVSIIPDQQDEFIRKLQNVIKVYNERQALKQNVQYLQNSVSAVSVTQVISNNPQSSVAQQQQPTGSTIHHMPSTLSVQTETQQRQENLLRIQQLQQTLERCRELGYQA